MNDETAPSDLHVRPAWWLLGESNPIVRKDLTVMTRTPTYIGTVVLAVVALGLLVLFVGVVEAPRVDDLHVERWPRIGKTLFEVLFCGSTFLMTLIGASLGASAIAQERDARTLDALTLSSLGVRRIVLGKFVAAYLATIVIPLATLPIVAALLPLGGTTIAESVIAMAGTLAFGAVAVAAAIAISAHAAGARRVLLLAVLLAVMACFAAGMFLAAMSETFALESDDLARGPFFFARAYLVAPLTEKYLLGLIAFPAYALVTLLSLSYLTACAGLMPTSEDRTLGLKRWAAASVTIGGGLLATTVRALDTCRHEAREIGGTWAVGVAGIALCLLFVFAGEPLRPSRRMIAHPPSAWAARLFPACLAPSIVFVLAGAAAAIPAGIVLTSGLDAGLLWRGAWGVAFVASIGALMGLVAANGATPTAARAWGAVVLLASLTVIPLVAAIVQRDGPPVALDAMSPGWVAFADHDGARAFAVTAGGTLVLGILAVVLLALMFRALRWQRAKVGD
jgi:ABC-type transport system involved in multi-copper enzyme maturation permease subunit